MNKDLKLALSYFNQDKITESNMNSLSLIKNPSKSYLDRHRGNWFIPEYNFSNIQNAQDTESLIGRAIELKSNKFLLAGWNFVGQNPTTVEYIKNRIQQIEIATKTPFDTLLHQTVTDLERYSNAMWVLVRNEVNSGGKVYSLYGKDIKPISGFFIVPFETCEFLSNSNGVITKIRQNLPGVTEKPEFTSDNFIHFYKNKKPGFSVGSPILFSVLEDASLLRRIEENVEELIEANLFPLFHYKIGTDKFPQVTDKNSGLTESQIVAQTLEYMPSSGVYVSDWRHEVTAIGSEGKSLRIDFYLDYFKKRVYAGLGVSPVDFGESGDASRSTAQTQSRALIQSVESLQKILKTFIDFYVIRPLLMESSFGFNTLSPENIVEINFGKIDTAEQTTVENSANNLWLNNAITHEELRSKIGLRPLKSEHESRLKGKLFPDPIPASSIKPGSSGSTQDTNQHKTTTKKTSTVKDDIKYGLLIDNMDVAWNDLKKEVKFMTTGNSPGELTNKIIDSWTEKYNSRLYSLLKDKFDSGFISVNDKRWDYNLYNETLILEDYSLQIINNLTNALKNKIQLLKSEPITIDTIFESLDWRIKYIQKDILYKSYNYGRALGFLLENDSIKIVSEDISCETCKKHNNMIITKDKFDFELIPPSIKHGHPNCKCRVELNG